jgi:hypothetical protein
MPEVVKARSARGISMEMARDPELAGVQALRGIGHVDVALGVEECEAGDGDCAGDYREVFGLEASGRGPGDMVAVAAAIFGGEDERRGEAVRAGGEFDENITIGVE